MAYNPCLTTIHTACVSWRQLEIELDGLAELDDFWSRIPAVGHKAWSERASHVIVDASPRWDVLRSVPLLSPEAAASAAVTTRSLPQQQASSSQDSSSISTALSDTAGLQIPLEDGQAEALLAEQVRFLQLSCGGSHNLNTLKTGKSSNHAGNIEQFSECFAFFGVSGLV